MINSLHSKLATWYGKIHGVKRKPVSGEAEPSPIRVFFSHHVFFRIRSLTYYVTNNTYFDTHFFLKMFINYDFILIDTNGIIRIASYNLCSVCTANNILFICKNSPVLLITLCLESKCFFHSRRTVQMLRSMLISCICTSSGEFQNRCRCLFVKCYDQ